MNTAKKMKKKRGEERDLKIEGQEAWSERKKEKNSKKHNCTSLQRQMKGVNNPIPKIRVGKKRTDKGLLFLRVIKDGEEMLFTALW